MALLHENGGVDDEPGDGLGAKHMEIMPLVFRGKAPGLLMCLS